MIDESKLNVTSALIEMHIKRIISELKVVFSPLEAQLVAFGVAYTIDKLSENSIPERTEYLRRMSERLSKCFTHVDDANEEKR